MLLNKDQIIYYLNQIHEHTMAKDIFVPLLKKMGLKGVKFTGGPDEQGVDIEYYEFTQPENNKSYVGIQFKKNNLTYGSGGGKNTVKEVKNQAEEAFEKEIHDIESKSTVFIGRFIVGVTGEINEKARAFIGKARQKGNDRRIDYWDGSRLAEYILDHWTNEFIDYFNIESNKEEELEKETEIVDEDYILEYYSELVKRCSGIKATVSGLEFDILTLLAKEEILENQTSGVPIADLLIDLGKSEEYLETELRNLVTRLEYIEFDENHLYLNNQAVNLSKLLSCIVNELIDAEEEVSSALSIFQSILKY